MILISLLVLSFGVLSGFTDWRMVWAQLLLSHASSNQILFNTFWLQDLQGSSSFNTKRKLELYLYLLCSIHKKSFIWLPVTLGSPSLNFSIFWLPSSCLVWIAFPFCFLAALFSPFFTQFAALSLLVCSPFLLVCSPLLPFWTALFYPSSLPLHSLFSSLSSIFIVEFYLLFKS